jgi:hypothetical protein
LGVLLEPTVEATEARRRTRFRGVWVPRVGERIERWVGGLARVGTVHYSDDLQVLVKWDDGSSSSLRVGRDRIYPAA